MLYLRDNPAEAGCYFCRRMTETDSEGTPLKRTFTVASFVSLSDLERWAAHHPSHLRIFNRFLKIAKELGGDIQLRLWHEVAVLQPHDQLFEYANCSPSTGMLPYLHAP